MVPSPPPLCSPTGSCSCPGYAARTASDAPLWGSSRREEPARCEYHTRRRRPACWAPAPPPPSPSRRPSRTRRILGPIYPLFPGRLHPLYGPAHGGATDLHGGHRLQILAPLLQGEKGALLEIRSEQPSGPLVQLRLRAGPLLGRQRATLLGHLGVAFYGGERDGEGAGGLALAHPSP